MKLILLPRRIPVGTILPRLIFKNKVDGTIEYWSDMLRNVITRDTGSTEGRNSGHAISEFLTKHNLHWFGRCHLSYPILHRYPKQRVCTGSVYAYECVIWYTLSVCPILMLVYWTTETNLVTQFAYQIASTDMRETDAALSHPPSS